MNIKALKLAGVSFLLLLFKYIINLPNLVNLNFINNNRVVFFIANYQDLGFIPRALFGSIIHLFTDYISVNNIKLFYLILYFILFIIYFIVSYKLLIVNKDSLFVKIIISFFFIYPFTLLYFSSGWGSFDLVFILLCVFSIFSIIKCNIYVATIVTFFISFIIVLEHTLMLFCIIPCIFLVYAYRLINEKVDKNKIIAILISYISLMLITFIICTFFSSLKISSYKELNNYLNSHTNYKFDEFTTRLMYYFTLGEHREYDLYTISKHDVWDYIIYTHLFRAPLYIFFIRLWIMMIKNTDSVLKKILYSLVILELFSFVPGIIFASDHKRYADFSVLGQVLFLISIFFIGEENDKKNIEEFTKNVFNKYKVFIMFYACVSMILFDVNDWYNVSLAHLSNGVSGVFYSISKLIS